jgi:ABC-type nitrate/sulfonate/bicarbonate transport system substrate-binding protein
MWNQRPWRRSSQPFLNKREVLLFRTPDIGLGGREVKNVEKALDTLKLTTFIRSIPLIVGERKGFFVQGGIRLETTKPRNSAEQVSGILSGTTDIMHTSADNIISYNESQGTDLCIFLGIDRGMNMALFVRPDIHSVSDLRGESLGVDAVESGFSFVLRKMLLAKGLDFEKKDYELFAVGGSAQRYGALTSGRVAGALLNSPYDECAKEEGFVPLVLAKEVLESYLASVWAGRRAWARAHSDLLTRALRAYVKSVDWVSNSFNRQEVVDLLAEDQKISRAIAARRLDEEMNPEAGAIPKAVPDLRGLDAVIKLRAEMGFIKGSLPLPEKYCDCDFYNRSIT